MFKEWTKSEIIRFLGLTSLIVLSSVLTFDKNSFLDSFIASLASITGLWCVILVAKGRLSNYYWGIANAVLYSYASFKWGLYGDLMLHVLVMLPMQFIGLASWRKHLNNNQVVVKRLSNKEIAVWSSLTFITVIIYGFMLKLLNGNFPLVDSTSTILSIVALILMTRRYIEQWILWIIVNIASIVLWSLVVINLGGSQNIGIIIMWSAFLINSIYGLIDWVKLYQQSNSQITK